MRMAGSAAYQLLRSFLQEAIEHLLGCAFEQELDVAQDAVGLPRLGALVTVEPGSAVGAQACDPDGGAWQRR